ncbi:hypothetical protein EVAR_35303_1 [Eumeta japonica]|uniref:Uncharacterized protein n=1 Tax=Eumeta variegata TaxID=151549 RepID=A0A4C1XJS3_EUMVA|nr:hypothetical protein EVAR_35303_1 [Eumeta japonica]
MAALGGAGRPKGPRERDDATENEGLERISFECHQGHQLYGPKKKVRRRDKRPAAVLQARADATKNANEIPLYECEGSARVPLYPQGSTFLFSVTPYIS